MQTIADDPQVMRARRKLSAGQKVTGSDTCVPGWLGEIMVYGPTVEAASQVMEENFSRIEFSHRAARA